MEVTVVRSTSAFGVNHHGGLGRVKYFHGLRKTVPVIRCDTAGGIAEMKSEGPSSVPVRHIVERVNIF
jgi:hypothetical protein